MNYYHYLLAFLLLSLTSPLASSAESWQIAAHQAPLPKGASQELRDAIDSWPVPHKPGRLKHPTNESEWLTAQAQRDSSGAENIPQMADLFKVQIERKQISGVAVAELTPAIIATENKTRLFVFVHGGAYVYGAGDAGLTEGIVIAGRLQIPVLSIDYRMPPKHSFPAAIDDAVSVYRHLLEHQSADSMIIGGTSAGGGLALAVVHKLRQLELRTPAAVYAGTAWADLTKTGDTIYTNEGLDRILVTYDGSLEAAAKLYAAGHDMKDPLISPVYGDFNNFPPVILVSGTRDLFLSDVARTHRKLRAAGVDADLHVYEGMSHAGYIFATNSPESLDMYGELGRFVDKHLAR